MITVTNSQCNIKDIREFKEWYNIFYLGPKKHLGLTKPKMGIENSTNAVHDGSFNCLM